MSSKNNKKQSSFSRAGEIISILRSHKISEGMTPLKLRLILEDLGPTFIKLGQIASMHADILPPPYCQELSGLCSNVAPMPYEEVISIIEQSCGCPYTQVFSSVCPKPEGSASIAQVHRAQLLTGEQVVIKIQRPLIYDTMEQDIKLLHKIVRFLPKSMKNMADFDQVLDEVWEVTKEEMNFVKEAENMKEFAGKNKNIPYIASPQLYDQYTSDNMLVMEYVDGLEIDDKKALTDNGYDLQEIAQKLADNYIKQIIDDGFFHADPHHGNLKIRDGKIVWIDMGMMGRLTDNDRAMLTLGVEGIALDDYEMIEKAVLTLGEFQNPVDRPKLKNDIEKLLEKYGQTGLGNMNLEKLLSDLMDIMRDNQIKMPYNLTLLIRGLTHMQGLLAELSPDINMVEIAKTKILDNSQSFERIKKELEESSKIILQSLRKSQDIPSDLSYVLKEFRNGQSRMQMDMQPSSQLTQLLYRLVYTLVEGLIIAALVIGASILCSTTTQPQFLGMPVMAAILYALAILLAGHMIVINIQRKKK